MNSKTLMKTARRNKTRGDTIIEVLISIAIVGLVIAGAYALASRSLQQGITASERTEALKLAEGQIEHLKLRHRVAWTNNFYDTDNNNFCLGTSATGVGQPGWDPIVNNFNPTVTPTTLTVSSGTEPGYINTSEQVRCVSSHTNPKYFIDITFRGSNIPNPTYLITVRWNAIGGGQNQTQLYYRF